MRNAIADHHRTVIIRSIRTAANPHPLATSPAAHRAAYLEVARRTFGDLVTALRRHPSAPTSADVERMYHAACQRMDRAAALREEAAAFAAAGFAGAAATLESEARRW